MGTQPSPERELDLIVSKCMAALVTTSWPRSGKRIAPSISPL